MRVLPPWCRRPGRARPLALLLLAALLVGCGPELERAHQGPPGSGEVGASCLGDHDCTAELLCFLELPGGFCSRLCQTSCPGESLCVRTDLPDGSEIRSCAPLCDAAVACRPDYRCLAVGTRSVCSR